MFEKLLIDIIETSGMSLIDVEAEEKKMQSYSQNGCFSRIID